MKLKVRDSKVSAICRYENGDERWHALAERLGVSETQLLRESEWEVIEKPRMTFWGDVGGWGVKVKLVSSTEDYKVFWNTAWFESARVRQREEEDYPRGEGRGETHKRRKAFLEESKRRKAFLEESRRKA